jgi:hypothetical protein
MVVASHAPLPEAETILIVEDELPVRFEVADVASAVISHRGRRPVPRPSSSEIVCDLLLCDL